jgi:hypothetical protein
MQLTDNYLNLQAKPDSSFSRLFDQVIKEKTQGVTQTSFDALQNNVQFASPDVDQYRFQKDFNPNTFNPFDPNNQERWTNKETWSSALEKGFDGFKTRFGNTFVDYWKDYGRMADALTSWDMTKMMPSELDVELADKVVPNPSQISRFPPIVGISGIGLTVTLTEVFALSQPLMVCVT